MINEEALRNLFVHLGLPRDISLEDAEVELETRIAEMDRILQFKPDAVPVEIDSPDYNRMMAQFNTPHRPTRD